MGNNHTVITVVSTENPQSPPGVFVPHQQVATMMSYYFYMIACYTIGFCTRSVCYPFMVFVLWHFVVFYHLWGTGYVTLDDYNTYYTLVALAFSILGWTLAAVLNVPSLFNGQRLGFYERGVLRKGFRKLESSQPAKVAWIYRVFLGIVFCVFVVASTLCFELIPYSLSPLGMICSLLCLCICVIMFFYAFRAGGKPKDAKRWQAVYIHYGSNRPLDMTADVSIHLILFYVGSTVSFCIPTVWISYSQWWPFWTALIIFGVYLLFYVSVALCLRASDSHYNLDNDMTAKKEEAGKAQDERASN